jgi:hypothetical protein
MGQNIVLNYNFLMSKFTQIACWKDMVTFMESSFS